MFPIITEEIEQTHCIHSLFILSLFHIHCSTFQHINGMGTGHPTDRARVGGNHSKTTAISTEWSVKTAILCLRQARIVDKGTMVSTDLFIRHCVRFFSVTKLRWRYFENEPIFGTNDRLFGLEDQRLTSYEAEDRFGDLAETSLSTPLVRVGFLVIVTLTFELYIFILIIISLLHSAVNCGYHLTSNLLPHYFAKFQRTYSVSSRWSRA